MDLDLTLLLFPVYTPKLSLFSGCSQKYCNPNPIVVIYPVAGGGKGMIFIDGQVSKIFKKEIACKLEKIWEMTLHESKGFNC